MCLFFWPIVFIPLFLWPIFPFFLIIWPFFFLIALGCLAAEEHETQQYRYTYPAATVSKV